MNRLRLAALLLAVAAPCASPAGASVVADDPWGVNLWFHSDWTGDGAFIDATRTFRPFPVQGTTGSTSQGIPLGGGTTLSYMRGYEEGVYTLRYAGRADVSFGGLASLVPGSRRTGADGMTYADVRVAAPSGGQMLTMKLANVDAADPIRDVRLIAPGYDVDTGRTYRDAFIDRIRPFEAVRFMDWTRTNNSSIREWGDHRAADHFIQTQNADGTGGGVAWDHLVAMANEADVDAWINIPHLASDEYVRELAAFWHDRLEPGRKLYVEFSNEVWNASFDQYHELNPPSGRLYREVVGPRLITIDAVFDEVWGDDRDDVRVVLSGQAENAWHTTQALAAIRDAGLSPADVVDGVAAAPYINVSRDVEAFTTLDQVMASVADLTEERAWMAAHAAIADRNGLELYGYEVGLDAWFRSSVPDALQALALKDPRLADVYREHFRHWREVGGDLMLHYTFTSAYEDWGLLDNLNTPGSIRWDTLMDLLLGGGDATLDGAVGYDDFLVVRDHFGGAGWWEQGDFTGDRVVDAADWTLLRARLDLAALTPDQLAEVTAFGVSVGTPVPAPGTLTMAWFAAMMLLARRR